jgi:hypothetical protein
LTDDTAAKYTPQRVRKSGTLTSALAARWCRALAVAAVCVLALQSMRLPLLCGETRPACCCPHHGADADCKCPVCSHQREVQSGKPYFKTCGHSAETVAVTTFAPAVPVAKVSTRKSPVRLPVPSRAESPPTGPALDVPTPPPLAQA